MESVQPTGSVAALWGGADEAAAGTAVFLFTLFVDDLTLLCDIIWTHFSEITSPPGESWMRRHASHDTKPTPVGGWGGSSHHRSRHYLGQRKSTVFLWHEKNKPTGIFLKKKRRVFYCHYLIGRLLLLPCNKVTSHCLKLMKSISILRLFLCT